MEAISLAPQMESSGSTKLTKGGAQVYAHAPITQAVLGPRPPAELTNQVYVYFPAVLGPRPPTELTNQVCAYSPAALGPCPPADLYSRGVCSSWGPKPQRLALLNRCGLQALLCPRDSHVLF